MWKCFRVVIKTTKFNCFGFPTLRWWGVLQQVKWILRITGLQVYKLGRKVGQKNRAKKVSKKMGEMGEFYEFRNFMNTWSQEQLHESFVNRLYECKPVKINRIIYSNSLRSAQSASPTTQEAQARAQLSNLWGMLNSVRSCFGPAMKTDSSRRIKWSQLPFTLDYVKGCQLETHI